MLALFVLLVASVLPIHQSRSLAINASLLHSSNVGNNSEASTSRMKLRRGSRTAQSKNERSDDVHLESHVIDLATRKEDEIQSQTAIAKKSTLDQPGLSLLFSVLKGAHNASMKHVDSAQSQFVLFQNSAIIKLAVVQPGHSSLVLGVMEGAFDAAKQHVGNAEDQVGFLQNDLMRKLAINRPGDSSFLLGVMKGSFDAGKHYVANAGSQVGLAQKNVAGMLLSQPVDINFLLTIMTGSFDAAEQYVSDAESQYSLLQHNRGRLTFKKPGDSSLVLGVIGVMKGSFDAAKQHVVSAHQDQINLLQHDLTSRKAFDGPASLLLGVLKGSFKAAMQYVEDESLAAAAQAAYGFLQSSHTFSMHESLHE